MKTMTLIVLLSCCLLATINTFAQSNNEVLVVRVFEGDVDKNSRIIVSQNGQKLEEVPLLPGPRRADSQEPNQLTIDRLLNKYILEGYKVLCASATGDDGYIMMTTYLLQK